MTYYESTEIGQMFYGATEIGEAWWHDGTALHKVFSGDEWALSDDFTRPDITSLAAPWVKGSSAVTATIGIFNLMAYPSSPHGRSRYIYNSPVGTAQRAQVEIRYVGTNMDAGVVLRSGNAADSGCYFVRHTNTGVVLGQFAAGATNPATIESVSRVPAVGDVLRAEITDTGVLTAYVNDDQVLTRSGLTAHAGQYTGILVQLNGRADNWKAGPL